MMHRLRTIERQLACQRAQVTVMPIAETFVDAWEHALDQTIALPDELDLIHAVVKAGVPVLVATPLLSYLDACRKYRGIPEPGRITLAIVHGYAETRFPPLDRCHCLANRPISPMLDQVSSP
jgi:hypothetical protein